MAPARRQELLDLCGALAVAAAYAASVVLRRSGYWMVYDLYYNAPIVVPFVLFLIDRVRRRGDLKLARLGVDAGVVALAASRVVLPVPGISGHTLFLVYALLTTRGVTRVATAVVLLEVTVIKLALWHDPSWLGGVLVGTVAARAFTRWLAGPAPPPAA
jgi:hypothetical protein